MGCDIHLYVEKRVDGKWTPADTWRVDPRYPEDGASVAYELAFYRGRNYNLFSMLADVRNGVGFAGVKTGAGFAPIDMPRDLPKDVTDEVRNERESWGEDGHSTSYFTLRELLDYDWTRRTHLQGWCNAVEWTKWSRYDRAHGGGPSSYSGGVSGRDVQHVSAAAMDALLAPVANEYSEKREEFAKQHGNVYALAEWGVAYYDAAGNFVTETIPRLLKLAGGTAGLDDVRIVFWFDN